MIVLLTIVTGLIVYSFIKYRERCKTLYAFVEEVPGPKPWPMVGNLLSFLGKDSSEIFDEINKFTDVYGKMYILWGLFNYHSVIVSDGDDLERILSSSKASFKSKDYMIMRPWLNDGLLLSSGQKWHNRRKIVTPSFHFSILERFVEVFDKQCDTLVSKLSRHCGGDQFDISKYITLCTLDIICEASMGCEVYAQDNPDTEYVHAVKTMSGIIFVRIFSILRESDWLFNLTKAGRDQKTALKVLHGFSQSVIQNRKQTLVENQMNDVDHQKQNDTGGTDDDRDFYGGAKKRLSFLDQLLHATVDGKTLSDSDVQEEVDTFMFEGHDTTTWGISFTIHCLAENPDIQAKLFDEVSEVLGTNGAVTYAKLEKLKYMEKVIKESMRIFPPVPLLGRLVTEETTVGGVKLPPGTNIMMPLIRVHRDPKYFTDPMKFDPERFDNSVERNRNAFVYVPFSAGQRNCVGQKFAMLEMKSMISKLLQKYVILPSDTQRKLILRTDLVLKSKNGVHIKLVTR